VTIHFDIPADIERHLRSNGADPNESAKESLLVELYRQRKVTHHQIAQALALGRLEVDALLKRHDVPIDLTIEQFEAEAARLRERPSP
jgi:predicted HTH domain antitoxin